jgi:hypothetical protein
MANFLTTLTGSMRQRLIHEADPVDPAGAADAYLPQVGATLVSIDGAALAIGSVPATLTSDEKLVTTAGTAEPLVANSLPAASGIVQVVALLANTGVVYVGGDTVDAATGYPLSQGDTLAIPIGDAEDVWLDAANDGDGVRFLVS